MQYLLSEDEMAAIRAERMALAKLPNSAGVARALLYDHESLLKAMELSEALAAFDAWRLSGRVPKREPTEAMVKAGVEYALGAKLGGDVKWPDYIRSLYVAMEGAR